MPYFLVTGATGGNTSGALAPNRIEIYDFVKMEDQFSLYIQALDAMYKKQGDKLSHFSIGGIHGLPYEPWVGPPSESSEKEPRTGHEGEPYDGGHGEEDPKQWMGYCTHGSALFPTWHRPYQVLQQHAIKIAESYVVDHERWKLAAHNLRAPYWDWAANIVPPDEVISKATLDILAPPSGSLISVTNPLLQYTFHPIHKSFYGRWAHWENTLRRPDNCDPDATTNVMALIEELKPRQVEITQATYNLLTRIHTWPAFSNHTTAPPAERGNTNSLEAIHDRIHNYVGGAGHMGDTVVAGFDPIFYLHHANVDRLLALWSALRPQTWVTEGSAQDGTATIPNGSVVDKDTDLTPFRATQAGFWASASITATSTLGYTYPEFNNVDLANRESVQNKVAQYINNRYGGSLFGLLGGPGPVINLAQAAASGPEASMSPEGINDWMARIRFKKHELGRSFAVLIFLGDVPAGVGQWRTSPNFVGTHVAFVNSAADQCANCRDQMGMGIETEGFVHLNSTIASQLSQTVPGVGSFEPDLIVDYLRNNIHWRLQADDGSEIETARVPSLEVTVAAARLKPKPGAYFLTDEDPIYYDDITRGSPGGARSITA